MLEWPLALIDWGVKATGKEKESQTVARVAGLISHYRPGSIILEDVTKSRRCPRIRCLLDELRGLAAVSGLKVHHVSPVRVRKVFLAFGGETKYEIAHAVARQLPELAPHLPRFRKPWISEDHRLAIFEAAALALAHFYSRPSAKSPGATAINN